MKKNRGKEKFRMEAQQSSAVTLSFILLHSGTMLKIQNHITND